MAPCCHMHGRTGLAVDYQIRLSDEPVDREWDAFVATQPHGHHVQTSLWGRVKNTLGYRTVRVTVSERGRIVAGGQLLIRQWAPIISIGYMPKGPVLAIWDRDLAQIIIAELKRVARANHCLVIALQPPNNDSEFNALLVDDGFQTSWLELAPSATVLIDLTQNTDQILKQMKRQTRQNVKRSESEGITTRVGTEADLPIYYQLHVATSRRQGFTPYPEEYFACMWRVFSTRGWIRLVIAEYQHTAVSALLLVSFGDTVIPKTLGWSGEHAQRRPNDAVFWAAIQWAQNHGYRSFDLEGIDREGAETKLSGQPLPDALRQTPDFFKLGFGGRITLFPRSYCFVPNLLWRWPCQQVFSLGGRGRAIQRSFERYRRRFG